MATASPTPDAIELPIVAETLEKLEKAMAELEPQVLQYNAYAEVKARLTGTGNPRPSAPRRGVTAGGRAGARQGGRMEQFLALVNDTPGKTLPEIAKEMGVATNYLYRIRSRAEGEGKVRVEGSQIFPVTELEARTAEIAAATK